MNIIDISLPISNDLPVWPGDPAVSLKMIASILKGDKCNVTEISLGAHTGTHIDAPFHFIQNGETVDKIPVTTLIGPCSVFEVDTNRIVAKEHLQNLNFQGVTRVLLKTLNSERWKQKQKSFDNNFVSLAKDAAQFLIDKKITLVGIDYLSIESFYSRDASVHKLLLSNDIVILEGLDLSRVSAGRYELICLPINLRGCEGAPARAVLRGPIS